MYAIELFVDSNLDHYARSIWKELKESHISSPNYQDIKGIRPHITLALYDHIDDLFIQKFDQYMEARQNQGGLRRIPIGSEVVGVFPQLGNCHLGLTMTESLMELHRHYYGMFREYEGTAKPFYFPDNWKPHISLATRLSVPDIVKTMEFIMSRFEPITGEAVEIGVVEIVMKEGRFEANNSVYSKMLLP